MIKKHPYDVDPEIDKDFKKVRAIIEIPLGSQVKYEFDKETGLLRMDRVLYTSFTFPFNYGFVPQTIAKDGDPIDIVILSSKSFYSLSLVRCRIIGLLKIKDSEVEDDKIIAVPIGEPEYDQVKSIKQIPKHIKKLIEHFYSHYKDLEGKKVKVIGWFSREKAKQLLKKSLRDW